jgi:hypothetical protein
MYQRAIRVFADLTLEDAAAAVPDDPLVRDFNKSIYALWWMTRALAEYLLDLLNTSDIEIDAVAEIIQISERNIDLAWVVHFLHDFAFLVLDFKQAVRANQSTHIDLLWREFFATGHSGSANKTMYTQMAIMRIWWADALAPPLAELYHSLRAIPMSDSGSCVGWDTVIEWLNAAITAGVTHRVSEERIKRFVRNYSFSDAAYRALLDDLRMNDGRKESFMKSLDSNVNTLKAHLSRLVGRTWQEATTPNSQSKLGIQGRQMVPWEEVDQTMSRTGRDSVPAFVARHVRDLTGTFYAFA